MATEAPALTRDQLAALPASYFKAVDAQDLDAMKVATEQSYIGELVDGTRNDMHNCNFFDVRPDGTFGRVIIWMAGTNPLR